MPELPNILLQAILNQGAQNSQGIQGLQGPQNPLLAESITPQIMSLLSSGGNAFGGGGGSPSNTPTFPARESIVNKRSLGDIMFGVGG